MTLLSSVNKKIALESNLKSSGEYFSPTPDNQLNKIKQKKHKFLHSHIKARVDCSSPFWSPKPLTNALARWERGLWLNYMDNLQLVAALRKTSLQGGKVDCLRQRPLYYNKALNTQNRNNTYRKINQENRLVYKLLKSSQCRVASTTILERQWKENKRLMVENATTKFILFPLTPKEDIEDSSFLVPAGVSRPRVTMQLRTRGGTAIGPLKIELLTDVSPRTCRLFTELLEGDGLGFGYVGTRFFRKVPGLYWSGGDVVLDSGWGCYAQRGRRVPIGAETHHLSHSMPGVLSMRVTVDDEVCGIFTITFKPLPQLDRGNVVFGRVVRPSRTFYAMQSIGAHSQVEISSTTRRFQGSWIHGAPNTKIPKPRNK